MIRSKKITAIAASLALGISGTVLANVSESGTSMKTHTMEKGQSADGMVQRSQGMVKRSTVKEAQIKLKDKGFDLVADGTAGVQTRSALKKFQADNGLEESGTLTNETLTALGITDTFERSPASVQDGTFKDPMAPERQSPDSENRDFEPVPNETRPNPTDEVQ